MKKLIIAVLLSLIGWAACAQDQIFPVDEGVRQMLEDRGLRYMLMSESENEFRIVVDLKNGRHQAGFIDSRLRDFMGYPFRDVMSLVLVVPDMPSQRMLYHILEVNERLEMGAFEMFHNGTNYVVRYKCRVAANLSPSKLMDVFYYAVTVSDELERYLTDGADVE